MTAGAVSAGGALIAGVTAAGAFASAGSVAEMDWAWGKATGADDKVLMLADADPRLMIPLLIWLVAYISLMRWTIRRAGPAATASSDATFANYSATNGFFTAAVADIALPKPVSGLVTDGTTANVTLTSTAGLSTGMVLVGPDRKSVV